MFKWLKRSGYANRCLLAGRRGDIIHESSLTLQCKKNRNTQGADEKNAPDTFNVGPAKCFVRASLTNEQSAKTVVRSTF